MSNRRWANIGAGRGLKGSLLALATVGVLAAVPADALGHGFRHHHPGHRGDVFGAAVVGGLLGGLIGSAIAGSPRHYAYGPPPGAVIERRYYIPYDPPPAYYYDGGPSRVYCYGPTRYYDHGDGDRTPPKLLRDYPRCED